MSDERRSELAERLLAHQRPEASTLVSYRKEMTAMIEREQRRLRRERVVTGVLWVFLVALLTAWTIVAANFPLTPARVWTGFGLMAFLIYGAAEILKSFINRARVDLLKEIKEAELRLLEALEARKTGG